MVRRTDNVNEENFFLNLGEELRRQAVRPNINGYVPHAKQVDFHSSPARTRLYVGGNRSGKSFGGIAETCYWLKKEHPYRELPISPYEPTRGRLVAVDFLNGVDRILLPLLKQLIPPSFLIDGAWESSYHRASHTLTLNNDSFVEFLSYEQDLDKFAGTSRHFIGYDEEPPESIYTENRARLIDTGGHEWLTMTPVEGMSWVYDKFYLPGTEGKDPKIHVTEIEATDNPYISKEEIDDFLESIDDDEEREARKSGRFIEMSGLIYKSFDPNSGGKHVLPYNGLIVPQQVPVGLSLDHGYNNPTAVLWHAMFPDGLIITFHEHYLSGEIVSSHARHILEYNRKASLYPQMWIADPSIRNTDPISGTSIQQEYSKYGINWTLANNDVKAGIARVNAYLRPRGAAKRASWMITQDCKNTIKEMRRYKWKTYSSKKLNSKYNLMEEPHKKDDHACDSLRYFIMSRPDLDDVFAQHNYREPRDQNFDGVTRVSGDFTVRAMRLAEEEHERLNGKDYAEVADTFMGGFY